MLKRFPWYQYRAVILLLILAFAFFTRMYRLHQPAGYIFDEVYHALTAKLISRNDPRAFEWWNQPVEPNTAVDWLHPPLAKYTQAFFILMFGENSFGWRFSSVLFGVLVILMIYHLSFRLFKDYRIALMSAFLASLDGLLLVQSRIAMNDIHVTFFILLALYCYRMYREEKKIWRLFLTGLSCGLAMGTKWSGLFVLVTILVFETAQLGSMIWYKIWKKRTLWQSWKNEAIFVGQRLILLVGLPVLVYVSSYAVMFLQGKDFHHLIELHKQIWWYQTHLEATHPYQSRPLQWFLDMRPVWMSVEYFPELKERADIYAFGNPLLFWIGGLAAILTVVFILATAITFIRKSVAEKKKQWSKHLLVALVQFHSHPLIFLITAYFLVWFPWEFSPRIMFFYHYTPAVTLFCILIAYWFVRLWQKYAHSQAVKISIVSAVVACAIVFAVWYPHWVGIPVSEKFANAVYFALPQWR